MPKGPKGEKRPGTMIEIVIERWTNSQGVPRALGVWH